MPGWLQEFLTGTDMALATGIWNAAMKAVGGLLTMKPQTFSSGTWAFVNNTLYPFALSIGLSLLNLFFIIGWLQALTRLHENITLERTVDAMIKIVLANVLFLNIKTMIRELFTVASLMAGSVFTLKAPTLTTNDIDVGSFLILLTVYGRYIRLYLLVVSAPFALATIVGGEEARRTFISWIKTFLLNTFEIVMIALVMVICFKLTEKGVNIFEKGNVAAEAVNGFWDALNGLFTMVVMTASVKGVNSFMAKTFGL